MQLRISLTTLKVKRQYDTNMKFNPTSCDIFCKVVDNYGDIGVCWRLARQLSGEHDLAVRLWVDDLGSFARLCTEVDVITEQQRCRGVEVRHWGQPFPEVQPAELVIEAFACKLPDSYVSAMAKFQKQIIPEAKMDARRQSFGEQDSTNQYSEGAEATANNAEASLVGWKPIWMNLEYLSAEDWVEACHRLPSPHSTLPLTKYFFFPGFTDKTGGLLLEHDLLKRRNSFQSDAEQQKTFWRFVGMEIPPAETLKISLFVYENAALHGLLDAWANSAQAVLCLVPEGRILSQLGEYFADAAPCAGKLYSRGNLQVRVLPFIEQERYDELLWACDVNFVRGEDSFVRAQWAEKPFVWQIYPQHDAVHFKKLDAFLDVYGMRLNEATKSSITELWRAWSAESEAGKAWGAFMMVCGDIENHTRSWARQQAGNNLALNLLDFYREIGRMRALEIEGQYL